MDPISFETSSQAKAKRQPSASAASTQSQSEGESSGPEEIESESEDSLYAEELSPKTMKMLKKKRNLINQEEPKTTVTSQKSLSKASKLQKKKLTKEVVKKATPAKVPSVKASGKHGVFDGKKGKLANKKKAASAKRA